MASVEASASPIGIMALRAVRRSDEEGEQGDLLLVPPELEGMLSQRGHRSHASHRSHQSGRGHYSGSTHFSGGGGYAPADPEPAPPPRPRPARVTIIALPGGTIFVDNLEVGVDRSRTLTLMPGSHQVRVVNRFAGTHTATVEIADGQRGEVVVRW